MFDGLMHDNNFASRNVVVARGKRLRDGEQRGRAAE